MAQKKSLAQTSSDTTEVDITFVGATTAGHPRPKTKKNRKGGPITKVVHSKNGNK